MTEYRDRLLESTNNILRDIADSLTKIANPMITVQPRKPPQLLSADDFASLDFGYPIDENGETDVDAGVTVNLYTDAGKYAGGIIITHEGALKLAEDLLNMLESEGYGRESI